MLFLISLFLQHFLLVHLFLFVPNRLAGKWIHCYAFFFVIHQNWCETGIFGSPNFQVAYSIVFLLFYLKFMFSFKIYRTQNLKKFIWNTVHTFALVQFVSWVVNAMSKRSLSWLCFVIFASKIFEKLSKFVTSALLVKSPYSASKATSIRFVSFEKSTFSATFIFSTFIIT